MNEETQNMYLFKSRTFNHDGYEKDSRNVVDNSKWLEHVSNMYKHIMATLFCHIFVIVLLYDVFYTELQISSQNEEFR